MKQVPQFDVTLSYVALLLEEQRYEEALPILGTLMDMDPSDREARMYRLLVLRILVQRYHLSTVSGASRRQLHLVATRLITMLAPAISARLRSFGEVCRAIEPLFVRAVMNRLTISLAACGILLIPMVFYMTGGYLRAQEQPKAAFINSTHLIVSAVDLNQSYANAESEPELPSATANTETSTVIYEPADLRLPIVSWTEVVPAESIAQLEMKRLRRFEARVLAAKSQNLASRRNSQNKKIAVKEIVARQSRKDISAQYQSKRPITLRESASFAARAVQEIATGTVVSILELRGSWAKIEVEDRGITGFIRREFLTPVSLGRL